MRNIINDNFKDISIDKQEVLKYLGYTDDVLIDKNVDLILDECIAVIQKTSKPAFIYSYFALKEKVAGLSICDTSLVLNGKSIHKHLKNCHKVAVICVTLSNEIDKVIMQSKFDVLRQLFLDMTASVYIEQICGNICCQLKNEKENENLFMTSRYGVGYGDLPLYHQNEVLTIVNAQKRIGLMASADGILTPRKSITAFIGFSKTQTKSNYTPCDSCLLRATCAYFERGEYCGK